MVKAASGLTRSFCPALRSVAFASVVPYARPGPAEDAAAMATLRATAIRTLRKHARDRRTCACCHSPWSYRPMHLAASALGVG